MSKFRLQAYALAILGISLLCLLLFIYPAQSLQAAVRGIAIWWDVLFPALFPFFVLSELMLGFGIVHFFGKLLDPVMRPLFRIPGAGGFVMAIGFASGYPVTARLTAQLWEQKLVSREEGERLVAMATTADPLFLLGAVAVGFFHDPRIGMLLIIAHYGAALIIGVLMRWWGTYSPSPINMPLSNKPASPTHQRKRLLTQSFAAMHTARMEDGRSLGQLLHQAVRTSLKLIFIVGGLVVFFSTIMEVLTISRILTPLYEAVEALFRWVGMPVSLSQSIINGLFEVTLGAKGAGAAGHAELLFKTAIAAAVISWAGLSVHAQVVSLLTKTNMRYTPFVLARFLHGLIAAILVLLCWGPIGKLFGLGETIGEAPTDAVVIGGTSPFSLVSTLSHPYPWPTIWLASFIVFILFLFALCIILALQTFRRWLYNRME